jgi:hypothetical protein
MAAFEQMVGEGHAHDCRPSRVLAPEPGGADFADVRDENLHKRTRERKEAIPLPFLTFSTYLYD